MGKLMLRLVVLLLILGAAGALYASFADLPSPMRPYEVDIPGAKLK